MKLNSSWVICFVVVLAGSLVAFSAGPSLAQMGMPAAGSGAKVSWKISLAPVYQFNTNLSDGGSFKASRLFFNAGASINVARSTQLGLGFQYDIENYDFSGDTKFPGGSPWNQVQRIGFDARLQHAFGQRWSAFFSPSVQWSAETDASLSSAITYGAVFGGSYAFSRSLVIGLGASAFRDIEEKRAFPFIMLFWQITPQWRLSNPLRPGPAGPAGLEVSYTPNQHWQFGLGGAWRSFRFRLDDTGVAPDGVGENNFVPVFIRATRTILPQLDIDFYTGALFAGELVVEDDEGRKLVSDQHGIAPFVGLSFIGRF